MKKDKIITILEQIYKEYEIDIPTQINVKIYDREEYLFLFDNEQKLEASDFVDNCYIDNIVRKATFVLMFSDYPDYGIINESNSDASVGYNVIQWFREIGLITGKTY